MPVSGAWDQLHTVGPAAALFAGAGVVLTADLIDRRAPVRVLTLLALAAGALYTLWHALTGSASGPGLEAFEGAVVLDRFALYFAFLLIAVTAAVTVVAAEFTSRIEQSGEFHSLLLISAGAMVLLAQANDLIILFVALETTSIAQFVLAGIGRDDRSSEAGLKYLLTGAVSAAVLLYGFALLWGISGATSFDGIAAFVGQGDEGTQLALIFAFVLVTAGLGFKLAIAPFQAWAPDVYQGAPTPVTTFLSVASKAAGFAIVLRVFYAGFGGAGTFISDDWAALFAVLAGVSMTFGNIAAMLQTDVKRLLAYSSIAQAGNIAVGVAAVAAGSTLGPSGVLFFLAAYAATNLGAFIVVIAVSERIGSDQLGDYAGLLKRSPLLSVILVLCLLSLTGIPPTAGFLAKLYVFNAAIQTGETRLVWLVGVAVLNTAIAAFYYLRWARLVVLDEPSDASPVRATISARVLLAVAAAVVLLFGLVPAPLISAAQRAAEVLQSS
ncbi:MAG: NADH-quinone oxidoreductase subunit N [Dehalococcoidia bacterium]|jgi:NADH-quinone oxidoreductase subunit N|nr:NADH-quinone oxidoreductase subunit N [Dehalococcoidia bacterium]